MTSRFVAPALAFCVALSSCAPPPEGLRETVPGDGPVIVIDWDAEPLPELPFPNDLAARTDPTSVTGLRVNISEEAPTESEREARRKLNELVGFGIYSPITVRFDARLDIDEIIARHPNDFEKPETYDDDAFYVINVDPESPDYLKPFPLDVGHGRFPMDAARTDRYFPNDTRDAEPSIVFDTISEDVNGNGVLDWGEDTDNDGVMDIANIWPADGHPREDLLTFYELSTDTLIFRPVVPLKEETTYAVVLTNRLVDTDGNPVVSPWKYINHTRQTEALTPLNEALPALGLSLDDVAYTWSFTTGRVTGDLVDIHRGLMSGEGPWPFLADDYPGAVTEATQVHEQGGNEYALDMSIIIGELNDLGLFDDESGPYLEAAYTTFSSTIVGGAFDVPYLLADRDDGGLDDADEWWQLDPVAGTMSVEPQRVAFSCVLPSPDLGFEAPYDVAIFGHGYGSSRFDFLGFAHAFNREGMAACAIDFPGHGPTVSESDLPLIEAVLEGKDLLPFFYHLKDSRYRDLNNDGHPDSGGDQWSADPFHTRDMVRQSAVDWMAMVKSFKTCGSAEMILTLETEDGPEQTSDTQLSCDWDDDGTADFGGPDAKFYIVGGSLGGINSAVAAGVLPEVTAWAPIVPGGGTLDIGVRTEIGGAVEALVGRMTTPMFLGMPQDDGSLQIVQGVNSVTDMEYLPVSSLATVPAGGRIVARNLDNGLVREGIIPHDGRFRLSIAADGLDPHEKRVATGMVEGESGPWSVADNEGLGDRLVVEIYDADNNLVTTLDTFDEEVVHEGVTMEAGSPLIAGSHGTGKVRSSPELRRLAMVISSALEPGDAISYAPKWIDEPIEALGGQPVNIAVIPTIGDSIVNVNTGIALGRAAGILKYDVVDDRYGTTVDQWLIDRKVVQGLEQHGPYTNSAGESILFDVDDLDDGTDGLEAPSDAPLRANRDTSVGVSAFRLPYVKTRGTHGFALPTPNAAFDINTFSITQIAHYFATDGQEFIDDPCMATSDCDFLIPLVWPTEGGR
ncbi:MAG: hypothetical protein KC912_21230 [Proteobacteria bacterium]|nr:hypothetical protein [Pseudomonadota bacterium]